MFNANIFLVNILTTEKIKCTDFLDFTIPEQILTLFETVVRGNGHNSPFELKVVLVVIGLSLYGRDKAAVGRTPLWHMSRLDK